MLVLFFKSSVIGPSTYTKCFRYWCLSLLEVMFGYRHMTVISRLTDKSCLLAVRSILDASTREISRDDVVYALRDDSLRINRRRLGEFVTLKKERSFRTKSFKA